MKSTDEIIKIVSVGGSVIVDASMGTDSLIKIASIAASTGARVIFKGANKILTESLVRIAEVGKGKVIFDLTE